MNSDVIIHPCGWKGARNFIWAVWFINEQSSCSPAWLKLLAVFEAEALKFLVQCKNPNAENKLMDEYRKSLPK